MANSYIKCDSTSLIIRETQIKTTSCFTPGGTAIIIEQEITSVGDGVEKCEPFCTVGGNVNWYSHYGEQYGHFFTN